MRSMRSATVVKASTTITAIALMLLLSGCSLPEDVQDARMKAPETVTALNSEIDQLKEIVAQMQADGEDTKAHMETIAQIEKRRDQFIQTVQRIDQLYDVDGNLRVDAVAEGAVRTLPASIGIPLSLLLGIGGTYLKTKPRINELAKESSALREFVDSLNEAKWSNEELKSGLTSSRTTIRTGLSPEARDLIDRLRQASAS